MSSASDFVIKDGVLIKYVGPGGDVVVPKEVTSTSWSLWGSSKRRVTEIGVHAFSGCSNLTSVVIPEGVTSIGDYAFSGCSNLTRVTIPDSVTSIRCDVFSGCSSLTSVKIPDGVTSIGDEAFSRCSGLTSVTIPAGVTEIGYEAFAGCSSLTSMVIPESVTEIHYEAFCGCSSLTSVVIPAGVTSISNGAFSGCRNLTSVTIPEGVTSINGAFSGCRNLTSVTIPDSVTYIAEESFAEETNLAIKDISILPASLRRNAIRGFVEAGGGREMPGFESHSKYIKSSAARLVNLAMEEPALLALMCREKLITPKNVELYVEAAQRSGNAEAIAMMLDYQANKISSKQKEKVEKRKEEEQNTVFERQLARQGKEGIAGLNIVVTGKLETFEKRDELKAFLLEKGAQLASSLTAKVDYLIMNDPKSDSEKARKAQQLGVEVISERRFNEIAGRVFDIEGTTLRHYYGAETDVVIPELVKRIGDSAFRDYKDLTSVTIPGDVTGIDRKAFYGCSGLTSVAIPDSVKRIGSEAFSGCSSLTSIAIPDRVTSISSEAFYGCSSLTSVVVPARVKSIGRAMFYTLP